MGGRTGLFNIFSSLVYLLLYSIPHLVSVNIMGSFTDAYPNIKRTDSGDHFELEVLHVSVWRRVQAQSHWERHLTCGKANF